MTRDKKLQGLVNNVPISFKTKSRLKGSPSAPENNSEMGWYEFLILYFIGAGCLIRAFLDLWANTINYFQLFFLNE